MLYCPYCNTIYRNDSIVTTLLDAHTDEGSHYASQATSNHKDFVPLKGYLCPKYDCCGILIPADEIMTPIIAELTDVYSIGVISASAGYLDFYNTNGRDIVPPFIEIAAPDAWITNNDLSPKVYELLKLHLSEFHVKLPHRRPLSYHPEAISTSEVIFPKVTIGISVELEKTNSDSVVISVVENQIKLLQYQIKLISSILELMKDPGWRNIRGGVTDHHTGNNSGW